MRRKVGHKLIVSQIFLQRLIELLFKRDVALQQLLQRMLAEVNRPGVSRIKVPPELEEDLLHR